jgi:hypothetical protein
MLRTLIEVPIWMHSQQWAKSFETIVDHQNTNAAARSGQPTEHAFVRDIAETGAAQLLPVIDAR